MTATTRAARIVLCNGVRIPFAKRSQRPIGFTVVVDTWLDELAVMVKGSLTGTPPHAIGVAGAVAVGKSTIANALASALRARGRRVEVVATDAFLYPNAELASRDLIYRKGFPETYDWERVVAFVESVKSGSERVEVPVYSHTIYDVVAGERVVLTDPDIVILEGVVALQSRVVSMLDAAIYVDAAEHDVRRWFADRFLMLVNEARTGAESFYKMFADYSDVEVRRVADGTWDGVNRPNLHEHIEATRANATIVVEKGRDHQILSVRELG